MSGTFSETGGISVERSLLLWCMRVWLDGLGAGALHPSIGDAFGRLGAPEAACGFQLFMTIVCGKAWRPVNLRGLAWRSVSEDELVLLDVIALTQGGRSMEAVSLLRGLLLPAQAQAALHQAGLVGTALADQGWCLDEPEPAIRHYAMIGTPSAQEAAGLEQRAQERA